MYWLERMILLRSVSMKSKTKYRCPKCSCRMFPGVRPLSVSLPDNELSDPSGVAKARHTWTMSNSSPELILPPCDDDTNPLAHIFLTIVGEITSLKKMMLGCRRCRRMCISRYARFASVCSSKMFFICLIATFLLVSAWKRSVANATAP